MNGDAAQAPSERDCSVGKSVIGSPNHIVELQTGCIAGVATLFSPKFAALFTALVEAPMEPHPLDSLTPSERNVLRMLLQERDQKAIARQLNLSPETVKTHLRNAREKAGIRTSFALARALAEQESHPPEEGIPHPGGQPAPARSAINQSSKRPEEPAPHDDAFHEGRAVFDYGQSLFTAPAPLVKKRNSLPASTRMLIVIGLCILLVVLIILAFPLSESFQRFANVLDPPKH
jgi:DNA-binding CsgD family transcriptional regulator